MTDRVISDQQRQALEAQRVAAVLTRYSVACDERNESALAALFHPEASAIYDVDADLVGNEAIAAWIFEATSHLCWQQHALRVMSVVFDDERASAISYLTSHQVAAATPDVTMMMNSRYDTELELVDGEWLIRRLKLVVGTVEHRPIKLGSLVATGNPEVSHV